MKRTLQKLNSAHSKYVTALQEMESELSKFIDFEFNLLHQEGDGFVMCHDEHNVTLSDVMQSIENKGHLSMEDYLSMTI